MNGRVSPAFFEKMRQRLMREPESPTMPKDVDASGWEEAAARLLIEKMVVLDPGDGVETRTLRVFLGV